MTLFRDTAEPYLSGARNVTQTVSQFARDSRRILFADKWLKSTDMGRLSELKRYSRDLPTYEAYWGLCSLFVPYFDAIKKNTVRRPVASRDKQLRHRRPHMIEK
jgi:hypothetical protein